MEGSNGGTTFTDSAGTTTVEGQNVGRHYYGAVSYTHLTLPTILRV